MISKEGIESVEFYLNLLKDPRTKPEDEKEAKSALIRRVPQLISTIQELQEEGKILRLRVTLFEQLAGIKYKSVVDGSMVSEAKYHKELIDNYYALYPLQAENDRLREALDKAEEELSLHVHAHAQAEPTIARCHNIILEALNAK